LRVGHARGIGAICAEALPKFRPRNAGGQRGAAIPRRAGKWRDLGVDKPPAPDESKAEHIQAKHPPEADTAAVTRGLARGPREGAKRQGAKGMPKVRRGGGGDQRKPPYAACRPRADPSELLAEHPTRGLARGYEEGTRHKKLNSEFICLACTFLGAYERDLGFGYWDLGFGYWELGVGIFISG